MAEDYTTPPNHRGFRAKLLAKRVDAEVSDCAVAYMDPQGGGPEPEHTHAHDHLFVVLQGTATVRMAGKEYGLKENESLRVPGNVVHSVWNLTDQPVKMLGISIKN